MIRLQKDGVQGIALFNKPMVNLVSTVHTDLDGEVSCRRSRNVDTFARQIALEDYSSFFSSVDKNDQLWSYYGIANKAKTMMEVPFLVFPCCQCSDDNAYHQLSLNL